MSIKTLQKRLNECQRLLKAKRLQEASFEDIVEPGIRLLDLVASSKAAATLDLPPVDTEEISISKIINTSEQDLSTTDGTLNEAAKKKLQKVLEEATRSYQDLVRDYVTSGGTDNFETWKTWYSNQPDAAKAAGLFEPGFHRLYKHFGDSAVASEFATSVVDPDYKPSENLQSLLDVCHANEDFVETAATTVADKYETIELLLRRVVRGKSAKRYYILAGDAGIGKTYIVSKLLKEEGIVEDIDSITYTGSIGRSPSAIATFLWLHRNDEILVLDDCDSFLRKGGNPDVCNILKGCMEAGTGYKVGISRTIAARVQKLLNESLKRKQSGKTVLSEKARKLLEGELTAEEEEDLVYDTQVDIEEDDLEVPTSWVFNARMIIISNLHESQIEEPIWSRCDHYDLHLTQEEYLVRLAMIIDGMNIGQSEGLCTPEEAKEAKALVLSVIQSVIEAGTHGVKVFGKTIRLADHLEFRLVKDLANMWLAMLDRELETNPGIDRNQAKMNIMPKWFRIGVIPRLSAGRVL